MGEQTPDRRDPSYKLYLLTTPHVRAKEDVPHATEQKLLDDLEDLDQDGWEIAHVFASGTHILMKRKDGAAPRPRKKDEKDQT